MSGWLLALLTLPVCLLALWLWHLRRQEPGIGAGGSSEDEADAAAVIAAIKKEGGYVVEEGQGPEQPVITLELSQRTTFKLRKVNRTLARLPTLPRLETLSLGGSPVSRSGLAHLHKFPQLRVLNLGACPKV